MIIEVSGIGLVLGVIGFGVIVVLLAALAIYLFGGNE